MDLSPPFLEFPKIFRWSREIIVTEKIDGTNAQVHVLESGDVLAGSRNRYLSVEDDNFGFARWVSDHGEELRQLGPGRHFGEWWGSGIQRRYGLTEKRFSLFNVSRWGAERPTCCNVVPVLYRGPMDEEAVFDELGRMGIEGSVAAPGFMDPEGIVIFHVPSGHLYKKTLKKDEEPKGAGGGS